MSKTYFVYISKSVRKNILRIPSPWSERISQAIDALSQDPHIGEKMAGKLSGCRKIRVWPYRIIYKIEKEKLVIMIIEVGYRGNVSYT